MSGVAESLPRPPHLSAEEFREAGYRTIDLLVDYLRGIEERPVRPEVEPGSIRAALPDRPPEHPEAIDAVLADVVDTITPGLTHWQHPSFFAFFPANSSPAAVLGDLLSSGLGVQGMAWATSPACTELETQMMDWLVDLLDLPDRFRSDGPGGGVIQDSASSASLCALVAARDRALDAGASPTDLVAYASTQAHSSIEKDAKVAGLRADQLRAVAVDHELALSVAHLRETMAADRASGLVPFFVVATIGTTSTGALDPVRDVASVARDHGAWLHVDGAYAGAAAVCPELRFVNDGLETADSYVFNPHKWLLTNFDCSAFWVADRSALTDSLSVSRPYLGNEPSDSGAVIDYRDWQIPLGRRFRSLKLWFVLRTYGAEGLRAHIRRHVAWAADLAGWIDEHARFERVAPTQLSLVCFRHRDGNVRTQDVLDAVNRSGAALLSPTEIDGVTVVRVAIGGTYTEQRHVVALTELLDSLA